MHKEYSLVQTFFCFSGAGYAKKDGADGNNTAEKA